MSSTSPEHVLPRLIDPRKFAQQGVNFKGKVAISDMQRLNSLLANDSGEVQADLVFDIDEQRHRSLTGQADVVVEMTCQRCLDASKQPLQVFFNLAMVWSDEQASNLPNSVDPWIVEEGQSDIYQVIEDELILNLPMVAYHDHDCIAKSLYSSDEKEAAVDEQESKQSNPFQVLKQLKGSLESDPRGTEVNVSAKPENNEE
jgi:uncharacterized protein